MPKQNLQGLYRRSRRKRQFDPLYKYRGYACNIAPDDKLWCICGHDQHDRSSGVLEWCYDEEDAKYLLEKMQQFSQFLHLTANAHNDPNNPVQIFNAQLRANADAKQEEESK